VTLVFLKRLHVLFIPLSIFLIAPASARQPTSDATVAAQMATLKTKVLADPVAALPEIALARRGAAALPNQAKLQRLAMLDWLEGEANLRLNRLREAGPLISRGLAAVRRVDPDSRLHGDLLISQGGLYMSEIKVAQALADFQAAYTVYRQLNDRRAQAIALLNIASLYLEAKDYESVLRYTSQARDLYHGDAPVTLSIYNNRAYSLKELGRYREAEMQLQEALPLARSMNSPLLEAQVLRNVARTQLLAGQHAKAEATVLRGYPLSVRAGTADERAMLALGAQIVFQRGRLDEALRLIERSFAGVDLATTQLSSREAHETAYRIHAARHDTPAALAHLEALKRLDDEATKLATTTSTALMGARFDFANQELRIASLQRDEARRTVAFERARAASQRASFLGAAAAVAVIIVMLLIGLFTIRRSRNQVRAVAADLRTSNQALGKALAAKTEFLATTSHEIRTPLNGILGMTQVMLADRALEATVRDRLRLVHSAGTTMRALVDDILDVAKMETGNLTIEDVPFDPRATLADAARLWEDQARAKGIAFRVALDRCPDAMLGDAARLRQIAFNLLSNALKFTRRGEITLEAEARDGRLTLSVTDTGIGIAAHKLEEIFESFRQADAGTTREFGGTGLGLSICRNLAEAMGGRIEVRSELGRGSTFVLTLPHRVPAANGPVDGAPAVAAMLVIERNPIARAMLRTLFAPYGEVVCVADGAEALGWLADNRASAVLADAAVLAAGDQARVADAARAPVVLLCADAAVAAERAESGWRTVARPIAGARLVEAVMGASVISNSDTLAAHAA